MTHAPDHDALRAQHFERLGSYRNSCEFAEYSGQPTDGLPSLIGDRWEIDTDIYHEFLEILPPLRWRNGSFDLSEYTFADVTTRYTREGDNYYCEFVRWPEYATTADVTVTQIKQQQSTRAEREVQ
ncbi:MAG TPA: hypothetical protein VFE62_01400 [Gemmataceae bacterium]|nr:hypothetical protein [Gemmataceae bacterium]